MKNSGLLIVLVAGMFWLGSCSTVKVVTDTQPGADFSDLRTFRVVHYAPEEAQQNDNFRVNPINRSRIETAITREAESRGMTRVEEDPDVLILYASDVDIEESYTSRTDYMGGPYWGYRGRYYWGGPTYTTTDVNKYYIGRLAIAIVEPGAKEVLWYGQGTKDISGDANRAEETINEVVSKIMQEFPIGSTQPES